MKRKYATEYSTTEEWALKVLKMMVTRRPIKMAKDHGIVELIHKLPRP